MSAATASVFTAPYHLRSLLDSCKCTVHLHQAHALILKLHPPSSSAFLLLPLYSQPNTLHLPSAQSLFSLIPDPTIFQFNFHLRALSSASTSPLDSLSLYRSLLSVGARPNNFTFPFLLKPFSRSSLASAALPLHSHIITLGLDLDPHIQSSLIHLYTSSSVNDPTSALRVFDSCSRLNTVCSNAMLHGLLKCGLTAHARSLFDRIPNPDVISWNTMINAHSLLGDLPQARHLFDSMPQRTIISWNSILAAHARCGDADRAWMIWREMPRRDVFSWNTMLACCVQAGRSDDAFQLFDEMLRVGVKPTEATVVSLLSACAYLGALERGESLHRLVINHDIKINTVLATALVDMYVKCGKISLANEIFQGVERKDVLAWNSIMSGVAAHGHAADALQLLDEMTESGCRPDDITFVAVLTACSHAGMVNEGRQLLDRMKERYRVEPKVEHYGCVIDLLARKGMLEEAAALVESMPMKPNAPAWGALLGGCRIHSNAAVASDVGKRLLSLQPKHSGRYVLLSNIYASTNRWEDASKVRSMMVRKGISKAPGMSTAEFGGVLNRFVAGDQTHAGTKEIYKKLSEVSERLKVEFGYVADTKEVLVDIEEEEKEHMLSVHSEKLAVAYGLLHTSAGDSIRVMKNLRVCRDCHHFMKLVSSVYCREIVMRDRKRFHLFKDGGCSCADYW